MKTKKVIALFIAIAMYATAMSQNTISVNWTKSLAGQTFTGASQLYTVSTDVFNYEIHLFDATGNHAKVTDGTSTYPPKVLSFGSKLLLSSGKDEAIKVMNTDGTVIVSKTISVYLSIYQKTFDTKFFYTGNRLVRATFTTVPGPLNEYSTKIEMFTDSLDLISSREFVGMKFVGVSGNFLAGNMNGKGKLISISDTTSKEFTSPITGITAKGNDVYILVDKLYKLNSQLTELWNKTAQGTNLEFIADKAVIFNGTSAILYDSLFTSSLFTLAVNQSGLIGISSTSDAIYVVTGSSMSKIILGGSTPEGIEDLMNESSIVLYPNPTTDRITIKGLDNTKLENPTIEILNIVGQTIITTNQTTIDVSFLPAGLYSCRINGSLTKQFVIKK